MASSAQWLTFTKPFCGIAVGKGGRTMQDNDTTMAILDSIAEALSQRGFEPYEQIYGYFKTGDVSYITRQGEARQKIITVSREEIRSYLEKKMPGMKLIDK